MAPNLNEIIERQTSQSHQKDDQHDHLNHIYIVFIVNIILIMIMLYNHKINAGYKHAREDHHYDLPAHCHPLCHVRGMLTKLSALPYLRGGGQSHSYVFMGCDCDCTQLILRVS